MLICQGIWISCIHVMLKFYKYHINVVVHICYCTFCNSGHGVCLSTAGLPICENACYTYTSPSVVCNRIQISGNGRRGQENYSQLIPLTAERATALAPSSYTCFVGVSAPNTLSVSNALVAKGKIKRKMKVSSCKKFYLK